MGHFETDPATMRAAVESLATARTAIAVQVDRIAAAAQASTAGWRGAGGSAFRDLLVRYDASARALQAAVDRVGDLLAEQAGEYSRSDGAVVGGLASAGSALRL